ncbi:glycoside hydrolase family 43 protein [Nesterenkonia sp. HG001]|uniref:glycoside hydrolase family 43 protein n=1 Tax=Nesterenkonia sp. HG001 TaxID=2983207 RepID=UPI002AC4C826|nr:glycoside hydrolase family 43 protein [Nesterenkonia sp. HG001]MDZ5077203.1 glycoside hydrolase family 43 protein [Nesterenkonia sp. HG001]
MLSIQDIQIRDPYVLPDPARGRHLLFGSTDADIWKGRATGFDVYTSADLHDWEGPEPAFRAPEGFWSQTEYWAPEVHEHRGRWFMFATFGPSSGPGAAISRRGTAILVADRPEGPYVPHSDGPVTPPDWECLDGTLHVDQAGRPWMVFCHEWVQVGDGTICAVPLTEDLRAADGEPVLLFAASEAPWSEPVHSRRHGSGHVTDGPFLHSTADGALLMLWASFRGGRYAQGVAVSESGTVRGPWRHEPHPLYEADGGHGMIFRALDGRLLLTLHTPNRTPEERAVFIELEEVSGGLRVR